MLVDELHLAVQGGGVQASYFARSVPVYCGAGLLCLWGQLPGVSVNHIGDRTEMIQAGQLQSGSVFTGQNDFSYFGFPISDFWILTLETGCFEGSLGWSRGVFRVLRHAWKGAF